MACSINSFCATFLVNQNSFYSYNYINVVGVRDALLQNLITIVIEKTMLILLFERTFETKAGNCSGTFLP